ncbi:MULTISPECIES: OmpA family protein [unclassified Caballeronia]|uniref:OmpA family protein n=1 Tax=unclassified Caballeronia TaxID=2646786 RepID=UPI002857D9A1|nr:MULTISPECIES: OmpA family protein [unclassified Caballeronia]MDR5820939.1 OmpA family protein [Caballeronia sp. LZ043]MDR5879092.1 OmpA family protein [Caballeronia sp. LZ032]
MNIQLLLVGLVAAVFAGCTSYSSPMTNTELVTLSSGEQAWRVQCEGLFGSSETCARHAQQICKGEKVLLVESVDALSSDGKGKNDPRDLTFMCDDAARRPAPLREPVAAVSPVQKTSLTELSGANFDTNSARLDASARAKLDAFIEANRNNRVKRLNIAGYTDSTGTLAANESLSEARARSVQGYLTAHGMRAEAYDVRGFGPMSPVASNATAEGRAQNRRVVIEATGVEAHAD